MRYAKVATATEAISAKILMASKQILAQMLPGLVGSDSECLLSHIRQSSRSSLVTISSFRIARG